jgi:hypothetical protein
MAGLSTRERSQGPCRIEAARDPCREVPTRLGDAEATNSYQVSIGGNAFEGRIENLPGEGTLYRSFMAEGTRDCAQPER